MFKEVFSKGEPRNKILAEEGTSRQGRSLLGSFLFLVFLKVGDVAVGICGLASWILP